MVETLVRRERRPIWVALAIAAVAVAAAGTWLAIRDRRSALDEGTLAATRAGTAIAPILAADGVNGPLGGRRARIVRDDLEHALANRAEAFDRVRVFTTSGDILLEGRRVVAPAEDVAAAIADAAEHGSAGMFHDGSFLGYVAVTTPQGERVVELAATSGRFIPNGAWPVVAAVAAVLALPCLGLAGVATRQEAEIPRASRYRPAIPRRPLAAGMQRDVLPTVSVFAVGHDDLVVRHRDEAPVREGTDATATTESAGGFPVPSDAPSTDARLISS